MARSLGKSARILKSEAKAMKSEGSRPPPRPTRRTDPAQGQAAPRTIQASPGDVTSARPVNEPTDTTTSADGPQGRRSAACRTR